MFVSDLSALAFWVSFSSCTLFIFLVLHIFLILSKYLVCTFLSGGFSYPSFSVRTIKYWGCFSEQCIIFESYYCYFCRIICTCGFASSSFVSSFLMSMAGVTLLSFIFYRLIIPLHMFLLGVSIIPSTGNVSVCFRLHTFYLLGFICFKNYLPLSFFTFILGACIRILLLGMVHRSELGRSSVCK
ncbi:hypothetical protein BJ508DRAFT_121146 [Ascobolus immersus RN42]|uniref:Uncharacterized protein n=1 Tax=Ascobolus immersus RN42 TaxID=1160509 RepID=A0A3N4IMC5_ASCIM|nr:hypothetical protein BJ508DRAFT_121146 [Ascobolus immersus RN42]